MDTSPSKAGDPEQLRRHLHFLLSLSDEAIFIEAAWAINALQTGRADVGKPLLSDVPEDAAKEGLIGQSAVYPWELETLVNELLTTPKSSPYRTFDFRHWPVVANTVNLLRTLENAEYARRSNPQRVLLELQRIASRQFPWQRGFFNRAQLYRSAYIYGGPRCSAYLMNSTGLTIPDLTLVGFALISVFHTAPSIRPRDDLHLIQAFGITPHAVEQALTLIAAPLQTLRQEAAKLRDVEWETAYKPSILRRWPCALVGPRGRSMVAPLPDLIMDRVTTGLFYDVIGGSGAVRDEFGHRFENYCVDLLGGMLSDCQFCAETSYMTPLGQVKTPDVVMCASSVGATGKSLVSMAVECKAGRMGIVVRFGEQSAGVEGYEEFAKAVVQLWRFFAHCRDGLTPFTINEQTCGLVLTLDDWFDGRSAMIPALLQRANELADESTHDIPVQDRRPIAFCSISDLEVSLETATEQSILESVRVASGEKQGWLFSSVHSEVKAAKTDAKEYHFADAVSGLLPWFGMIGEIKDDAI